MKNFAGSIVFTIICLILAGLAGYAETGLLGAALGMVFIAAILGVMETSLSLDNAVVNASILKNMDAKWQRRFLTWGILIAVFGMRIVFPIAIVSVAAGVSPWEAARIALTDHKLYEDIVTGAHIGISGFGGAFLMLVGLSYFFDESKEIDWIAGVERQLRKAGSIRGMAVGFVLIFVVLFTILLPVEEEARFMFAALWGIITYLAVDALGHVLDRWGHATAAAGQAGLGAFLYLEVLDASFSFDGVIGAFALTQNLFLIAIGLGIGAMYVRSMTVMLVERGTLAEFRYLEHGAFWSILILSVVMFAQSMWHIPEVFTGLGGAFVIGLSLLSSLRWNRRNPA